MERVLVIGAGLLGSRLIEQAAGRFEVHAADIDPSLREPGCEFHPLDITDQKAVEGLLAALRPGAVFLTAALTNVDKCETDRELAFRINGTACGPVARACAGVGAHLTYISTDYVFDGSRGGYREGDPPKPASVYGESKLRGEEEVGRLGKEGRWVICRSSILYGAYRKRFNFATWIMGEVGAGRAIRVVWDQTGSPTLADDLAGACLRLWEKGAGGVFHVAGREAISRYDFALRTCEVFGLDRRLVSPVTTGELGQRARRPPNSSLDVSKVEGFLGRRMLDVGSGLERMRERWKELPAGEAGPASRTA